MSSLTKILIVLVSLLSILLGFVASVYVGTSLNYKEETVSLGNDIKRLESENSALRLEVTSSKNVMQLNQEKLQDKYSRQVRENTDLKVDLTSAEREVLESQRHLDKLLAELGAFRTTIGNMELSLQTTQKALADARGEGIKNRTELTQLTDKLYEQLVQIQNMQVQAKRLVEEKTVLEESFTKGRTTPARVTRVTPEFGRALPVETTPMVQARSLKGYVIEVKGALATVSIGASDGVNKRDVLHVYRGSEFICDIEISDVDTNKAAGVLQLVQRKQGGPRIGDTVTSEL